MDAPSMTPTQIMERNLKTLPFESPTPCKEVIDSGGSNQYAVRYCNEIPTRQCRNCGAIRCRKHYAKPDVPILAGQCWGRCVNYTGD